MERIARGSLSQEPTEVSKQFAHLMMKLMELEECFADNRDASKGEPDVDISKLRQRIKVDRAIDIDIFN